MPSPQYVLTDFTIFIHNGKRCSFPSFCSNDAQFFALFTPMVPFAEKCYRYREYIIPRRNICIFRCAQSIYKCDIFLLILQLMTKCHMKLVTIRSFPVSVSTVDSFKHKTFNTENKAISERETVLSELIFFCFCFFLAT